MNISRQKLGIISLIATALFLCTLLLNTHAFATSECIKADLEGYANFLSPVGPGVGMATISINDQIVSVINTYGSIAPPLKYTEDGTIHMTVLENDETTDGSTIQILDKLVLSPLEYPGEYQVLIKSTPLSGTGFFADIDGRYVGHGTLSFNNLRMEHAGIITLCGLTLQ